MGVDGTRVGGWQSSYSSTHMQASGDVHGSGTRPGQEARPLCLFGRGEWSSSSSHKGAFLSSLQRGLSWRRWAGSGGPHPCPERRCILLMLTPHPPVSLCRLLLSWLFKPLFLLSWLLHLGPASPFSSSLPLSSLANFPLVMHQQSGEEKAINQPRK